jgi:N-hydroxyarylamine O-acetyltransferase
MWEGNDEFDLAAYFRRIGYTGSPAADLETLRALHLAHATSIPFENLDPLHGTPVSLDVASLQEKLVRRGRGGYCYEHNVLFAAALRRIGFAVRGLGARVVWNQSPDVATPRTHMLLNVEVDGEPYLADVGFGGLTQTAPLRLVPNVEQTTPHETFRLRAVGCEYLMEALVRGEWKPLYRFDLSEQLFSDYEVANWFICTHPKSFFTFSLLAARPDVDRRYALRDAEFAVHHLGGQSDQRHIDTAAELRRVLEKNFLITLPDDANLDRVLADIVEQARSQ